MAGVAGGGGLTTISKAPFFFLFFFCFVFVFSLVKGLFLLRQSFKEQCELGLSEIQKYRTYFFVVCVLLSNFFLFLLLFLFFSFF